MESYCGVFMIRCTCSQIRRVALFLTISAVLGSSACQFGDGIPLPSDEELSAPQLGEVQVTPFSVKPSASSLSIAPDVSNLVHSDRLDDLSPVQLGLLVRNGFVIVPSKKRDMFELYGSGREPFVTTDALFHVWHVLLFDTLRRYERVAMLPVVTQMAAGACRRLKDLRTEAPASIRPDIDMAMLYWVKVWKLADPEVRIMDELGEAANVLFKLVEGSPWINDPFAGDLDASEFIPQAGYGDHPDLERYFEVARYLTMARLSITSPAEARQTMLLSLALWDEPEARIAWQELNAVTRLLAGSPEDIGPTDVLRVCRRIYGGSVSPSEMASESKASRLLRDLECLPRPQIEDRLADRVVGGEPAPTFRVLSAGVTLRALAFDAIADAGRVPSGLHIAALLGSMPSEKEGDDILIKPLRERLDSVMATPTEAHDLSTAAVAALAALSQMKGEGYPAYAQSNAWRRKVANTQMSAWSQVEHDTFIYSKHAVNLWSLLLGNQPPFAGSVEPAPEFFARLADVVHRTRTAFAKLGAFDAIAAARVEPEPRSGIIDIPATEEHFLALETLLHDLVRMAEAVLADRAFDEHQVEVLKTIGDTLEELSLDIGASSRPPMSTIVRVHRGFNGELFVGTGRPLEILVAVPWGDRLHLANGAVYSYYEFTGAPGMVIPDRKWKEMTRIPLAEQEVQPWVMGQGLGMDEE